MSLPHVNVEDFNPKEDTTVIEEAVILRFNCFKAYFIVPILSVLTLLTFAVALYWKVDY